MGAKTRDNIQGRQGVICLARASMAVGARKEMRRER